MGDNEGDYVSTVMKLFRSAFRPEHFEAAEKVFSAGKKKDIREIERLKGELAVMAERLASAETFQEETAKKEMRLKAVNNKMAIMEERHAIEKLDHLATVQKLEKKVMDANIKTAFWKEKMEEMENRVSGLENVIGGLNDEAVEKKDSRKKGTDADKLVYIDSDDDDCNSVELIVRVDACQMGTGTGNLKRKRDSCESVSESRHCDKDKQSGHCEIKKSQLSNPELSDSRFQCYPTMLVSSGEKLTQSKLPERKVEDDLSVFNVNCSNDCDVKGISNDSPLHNCTTMPVFSGEKLTQSKLSERRVENHTTVSNVNRANDCDIKGISSSPTSGSDTDSDYSDRLAAQQYKSYRKQKSDEGLKWDSQSSLLYAIYADIELCMKAVCLLYRQNLFSGKSYKDHTLRSRGTELAKFLINSDPQGKLNKSVEELQKHDPGGAEKCRTVAMCYIRQLFDIYKNKQDPFFPQC